jgi:hypothetical protein
MTENNTLTPLAIMLTELANSDLEAGIDFAIATTPHGYVVTVKDTNIYYWDTGEEMMPYYFK